MNRVKERFNKESAPLLSLPQNCSKISIEKPASEIAPIDVYKRIIDMKTEAQKRQEKRDLGCPDILSHSSSIKIASFIKWSILNPPVDPVTGQKLYTSMTLTFYNSRSFNNKECHNGLPKHKTYAPKAIRADDESNVIFKKVLSQLDRKSAFNKLEYFRKTCTPT